MNQQAQLEIEKSILGASLLEPEALDVVLSELGPSAFTISRHRLIFKALQRLSQKREPIDLVSVTAELGQGLAEAGGAGYLSELIGFVPTAANVCFYVQKAREAAGRRKLFVTVSEAKRALEEGGELSAIREQLEQALLDVDSRRDSGPQAVGDAVSQVFNDLDHASQNPGLIPGLSTGFQTLDTLLGGFQRADLLILAARPSMGKSALALNVIENVTFRAPKPIPTLLFSLEMARGQLVQRLLASLAEVDLARMRVGKLNSEECRRLAGAADQVKRAPLFIDDAAGLSIAELRARARQIKRRHDFGLMAVDYLQLMRGSGDTRTQEVGSISRGLKALAKEFNTPVLALSQLNRALENRSDKRPILADLRDSGEIEQDADVIMFIYRPIVHNRNADPEKAELIVAKQRQGPTGVIPLKFRKEFTKFRGEL